MFRDTVETKLTVPNTKDLHSYERARRSLKSVFKVLGISADKIEKNIDPFFDEVMSLGTILKKAKSLHSVLSNNADKKLQETFYKWVDVRPRLALVSQIETLVNEFNLHDRDTFSKIYQYLEIMNSFLMDSKKRLEFKEDGSLVVTVPSGNSVNVYHLSSGERQLFVLITALMFGDYETRANVLIIDEPELSLHIKWQEMFVGALLKASPSIQLILATHSPSIILERLTDCIELS